MNDFTESELLSLKMLILELDHFRPRTKFDHDLRDKIQFMIDNYCEHKEAELEWQGDIAFFCKSCGKIVTDKE